MKQTIILQIGMFTLLLAALRFFVGLMQSGLMHPALPPPPVVAERRANSCARGALNSVKGKRADFGRCTGRNAAIKGPSPKGAGDKTSQSNISQVHIQKELISDLNRFL
jgi:hypothetical protein